MVHGNERLGVLRTIILMSTLPVTRVRFCVYDRDVVGSEHIPLVTNANEIMGTSLYDPEGHCGLCYPTTSYCRGHIGKIVFKSYHVSYPYRGRVETLLRMMCNDCMLPVRRTSRVRTPQEEVKYMLLCDRYGGSTCHCTGAHERGDRESPAVALRNIYTLFRETESLELLRDVFGLGDEDSVLRNYVLVLPEHLISQVPNASHLLGAYRRLLELRRGAEDEDLVTGAIDRLYKELVVCMRNKPGVMRQIVLPRKMGHSTRAVIISDPSIDVQDIVVPWVLARKLSPGYSVSDASLQSTITLIHQGKISSISYGDVRCRLVGRSTSMLLVHGTNVVTVPIGCSIEYTSGNGDGVLVYSGPNVYDAYMLASSRSTGIRIEGLLTIGVGEDRAASVQVDCVLSGSTEVRSVPLQRWSTVDGPPEGEYVLVHRNPVLSAASMNSHRLLVRDSLSTSYMSTEERHDQRTHLQDREGALALVDGRAPYRLNRRPEHMAEWSYDMKEGCPVYVVTSSSGLRVVTREEDNNCCMAISPLATSTYGADFDGDEVNVALPPLGRELMQMLSLSGGILDNSVKLIHDYKYGLYCLVSGVAGLCHITPGYRALMMDRLQGDRPPYSREALVAAGLSAKDAAALVELHPGGVVARHVASYADRHMRHINLCIHNKSIEDFLVHLRLSPSRLSYMNTFNKELLDYAQSEHRLDTLKGDYGDRALEHVVPAFYSDVARCLSSICDHCVVTYSRLDRGSCDLILASSCRPQRSTIESIYSRVGVTSYPTGRNTTVSLILSSYSTGLTQEEYDTLCYSARVQLVHKAETTAPEGDNMRLQCSYMSEVQESEGRWSTGGRTFMETVSHESTERLRVEVASRCNRAYSDTLTDDSPTLEYRSIEDMSETERKRRDNTVHMGQRKLLMSEVEFLTMYSGEECLVVYAGAAPGTHISVLLRLFPHVRFHLYDRSDMSSTLYGKVGNGLRPRVTVYKEYVTKDNVLRYRSMGRRVLYISDIRTNTNTTDGGRPLDADVSRDNATNVEVVEAMDPYSCMVKFRLPYDDGHSTLLDGRMMLQCWSGRESTETRLVSTRPYSKRVYSHRAHEQRMFYHNSVRPLPIVHERCSTRILRLMREHGIRPHYDMYRETRILGAYSDKYGHDVQWVYRTIDEGLGSSIDYYIDKRV